MENNIKQDEHGEMKLPENLDNIETTRPKRKGYFSWPIFKEAVKSNRKGLIIASLANALIMMVIVIILGTLNINATSSSMAEMFDSASLESTLKTSSTTYYSSFYNIATNYEELNSSLNTLETAVETSTTLIENSTVENTMNTAYLGYQAIYALTSGTDEERHESAKATTISSTSAIINAISSLSQQEREVVVSLLDEYLDYKYRDSEATYTTIMRSIIPGVMADAMEAQMELTDDQYSRVTSAFNYAIIQVYDNGQEANYAATEGSFEIAKIVAETQENSEEIISIINTIEEGFYANSAAYLSDEDYKNDLVIGVIKDLVTDLVNENAYYSFLPTFQVEYVTSDLGWPITYEYTGEKDENGNLIKREVEVKVYEPEKFVRVSGSLSSDANMLQKMRKEALTGESYTQEEIDAAKAQASENIEILLADIDTFVTEFLTRDENNSNEFFDGSTVSEQAIINYTLELVTDKACDELLRIYNEENGTNYTSIYSLNYENYQSDANTLINNLYKYGTNGISAYKTLYELKIAQGYSVTDATLIAANLSGLGVMDQLPSSLYTALEEMGAMNTYGIFAGMIGFGIACMLIPAAYMVLLCNSLVAQRVESGSLAFTFSTPIKRKSFIITEEIYVLFASTVMAATLFLVTLLTRQIAVWTGSTDFLTSFTILDICKYSLGNYLLTISLGSICFLASSIFNKSAMSIGVGGGVSIFFYICTILGLFGTHALPGVIRIDAMNFFNFITIFSLFDTYSVVIGDPIYWFKLIGLLIIPILCFTASVIVFDRKDLPL